MNHKSPTARRTIVVPVSRRKVSSPGEAVGYVRWLLRRLNLTEATIDAVSHGFAYDHRTRAWRKSNYLVKVTDSSFPATEFGFAFPRLVRLKDAWKIRTV